ncbi:MAG: hypothetical protein K9H64_06730 [Bacteroidales bacterium]|nr:hypothetical protein [Bacteroidales bacterium]MCF8455380.1 hypothetical protein [Bacteroidales bacterium]
MKKTEIVQLSIIIFGILIIVRSIEVFVTQVGIIIGYSDQDHGSNIPIIAFTGGLLLMILIGVALVRKSLWLSKIIIKVQDEDELSVPIRMTRLDLLSIVILIISIYFLIIGFPTFFSSAANLVVLFFADYSYFKEIYQTHVWQILQYILIILMFFRAKSISIWIDKNVIGIGSSNNEKIDEP